LASRKLIVTSEMMMNALTPEKEAQLAQVLAVLRKLDTPTLIFESMRLRLPDSPFSATDTKRIQRAYGGVVAATKIQTYLESMRQANLRRLRVGQTIQRLNEEVRTRRVTDPLSVVLPAIEIPKLSGLQEMEVHTFVIAVNQLYTLLPIAARAAGHKVKPNVLKLFRPYIALRDFYEHPEQRVPGAAHMHAMQAFTESDNEEGLRMIYELPTDPVTGDIMLDGQKIDVSSRGVLAIQRIAEDTWQAISQSAIDDVEKHLRKNPDRIPDPRSVDSGFEVKVGGLLRQVPLLHEEIDQLFEQVGGVLVPVRFPVYDVSEDSEAIGSKTS
jgi:hypothetical protein